VSKRDIGPRSDLDPRIEKLRKMYGELFGLEPSRETILKIAELRRLIKEGLSVRESVRRVRLGWKNYYKYAPLIYMSSDLLIPIEKSFLRDYATHFGSELVNQVRTAVNTGAVEDALEEARKALLEGRIKRKDLGRYWLKTSQELIKKRMHEVFVEIIQQTTYQFP